MCQTSFVRSGYGGGRSMDHFKFIAVMRDNKSLFDTMPRWAVWVYIAASVVAGYALAIVPSDYYEAVEYDIDYETPYVVWWLATKFLPTRIIFCILFVWIAIACVWAIVSGIRTWIMSRLGRGASVETEVWFDGDVIRISYSGDADEGELERPLRIRKLELSPGNIEDITYHRGSQGGRIEIEYRAFDSTQKERWGLSEVDEDTRSQLLIRLDTYDRKYLGKSIY